MLENCKLLSESGLGGNQHQLDYLLSSESFGHLCSLHRQSTVGMLHSVSRDKSSEYLSDEKIDDLYLILTDHFLGVKYCTKVFCLLVFFNWRIIALPCCVDFCYTMK